MSNITSWKTHAAAILKLELQQFISPFEARLI